VRLALLFILLASIADARPIGGRRSPRGWQAWRADAVLVGSALTGRTWTLAYRGTDVADPWLSLVPPGIEAAEGLAGSFTPGGSTSPLLAEGIGDALVSQAVSLEGACWATATGDRDGALPWLVRMVTQGTADSSGQVVQYGNGSDGLFVGINSGLLQLQAFGPDGSFNVSSYRNTLGAVGQWLITDVYYAGGTELVACTAGVCTTHTVTDIVTGAELGTDDHDITIGGGLGCFFQSTEGYSLLWASIYTGASGWSTTTHATDCVAIGLCAPTTTPGTTIISTDFARQEGYWCRGEHSAFRPEDGVTAANCDATESGAQYAQIANGEALVGDFGADVTSGDYWYSFNLRVGSSSDFTMLVETADCPAAGCTVNANRELGQLEILAPTGGCAGTGCGQFNCNYPASGDGETSQVAFPVAVGTWFRVTCHYEFSSGDWECWFSALASQSPNGERAGALGTPDLTLACAGAPGRDGANAIGLHNFSTVSSYDVGRLRVGTTQAAVD